MSPVIRDGSTDDWESYRYDSRSQRVMKSSQQKTAGSIRTQRVIYLPWLELRTVAADATQTEGLEIINFGEAGDSAVRILVWTTGKPDGIDNGQVRYSYNNLTGSSGLEVDAEGRVISMEEFYPYGVRHCSWHAVRQKLIIKLSDTQVRSVTRQAFITMATGITSHGREDGYQRIPPKRWTD